MTYYIEMNWVNGDIEIHGNDDFVWAYHAPGSYQIDAFNKMINLLHFFNTPTADARIVLDALVSRKAIGHGG